MLQKEKRGTPHAELGPTDKESSERGKPAALETLTGEVWGDQRKIRMGFGTGG